MVLLRCASFLLVALGLYLGEPLVFQCGTVQTGSSNCLSICLYRNAGYAIGQRVRLVLGRGQKWLREVEKHWPKAGQEEKIRKKKKADRLFVKEAKMCLYEPLVATSPI